jgi:hypothetical protein
METSAEESSQIKDVMPQIFNLSVGTDDHFNFQLVCKVWRRVIVAEVMDRIAVYCKYDDPLIIMSLYNDSFALYHSGLDIDAVVVFSNRLRYVAPMSRIFTRRLLKNNIISMEVDYQILGCCDCGEYDHARWILARYPECWNYSTFLWFLMKKERCIELLDNVPAEHVDPLMKTAARNDRADVVNYLAGKYCQ